MFEYGKLCKVLETQVDSIGPWVWPINENGLWHIIASEWPHLKALWGKHVKKYDVCIQAGGSCGLYPRLLAETFKTVYTFEPQALSFYCLEQNCQLDNIFAFHAALGQRHAQLKLKVNGLCNAGEARFTDDGTYSVPIFKIDDLALEKCDFIQLDVETYELPALRGAEETIKKHLPVISCENGNEVILAFLRTLGDYKEVGRFGVGSDRWDAVYST